MDGEQQEEGLSRKRTTNLLLINHPVSDSGFMMILLTLSLLALTCLALGIFFMIASAQTINIKVDYYDPDRTPSFLQPNQIKKRSFTVFQDVEAPIYVYYQVGYSYMRFPNYINSMNIEQLAGRDNPNFFECEAFIFNADLKGANGNESCSGNSTLNTKSDVQDLTSIANPCGAIAGTFFNDSFLLFRIVKQTSCLRCEHTCSLAQEKSIFPQELCPFSFYNCCPQCPVEDIIPVIINETSILEENAHERQKYMSVDPNLEWTNKSSEHFIIWMETAGLPHHPKMWGIIQNGLKQGNYELIIFQNHDSSEFDGYRTVLFSTNRISGSQSILVSVAFFIMALSFFVLTVWVCDSNIQKRKRR